MMPKIETMTAIARYPLSRRSSRRSVSSTSASAKNRAVMEMNIDTAVHCTVSGRSVTGSTPIR
jgi:hypothetical protein